MQTLILLIAGLVCFLLAAFGFSPTPRISWLALGLAFWIITVIIGGREGPCRCRACPFHRGR
jgi:hypothetical protein